tara:strand:- start:2049 stop:3023 length:975 start_codon:yes stop_codon:yes gene_type:complete
MFRKIYDSLSMPVHIELLILDGFVCLKTWKEIPEGEFNTVDPTIIDDDAILAEKSLRYDGQIGYMEFPKNVSGVYHNKLPAGSMFGLQKEGIDFLPNIPDNIRDTYTEQLKGKYFRNVSYSWIDPTDPSISSGEKDGACWVIGVARGEYFASPAYNSLATTYNSKAHPLRSVRQYGSPASLFVYQPFSTDKFTECSMTLKYNKRWGFSTNVDGWETNDDYNYISQLEEAFPKFEVTSGGGDIDVDGTDTVSFKMVDGSDATMSRDCEIYLESTGGYLPKKRVNLKDGVGSFKVQALGLDADDTFKVKIGFRNYTGVKDVDYKVV